MQGISLCHRNTILSQMSHKSVGQKSVKGARACDMFVSRQYGARRESTRHELQCVVSVFYQC